MVFAFMTSRLGAPNDTVKLAEAAPNVLGVRLAYMETWNQRLRQARLARGFDNLTAFARSLGVKAPTAHNWESGATKELKGQNLINVCQKLQITHQWLLDGKGNMDDGLPATIEATAKIQMPPDELPLDARVIAALLPDATPRSHAALERIAEAHREGRLTEADLELLDHIAERIASRKES